MKVLGQVPPSVYSHHQPDLIVQISMSELSMLAGDSNLREPPRVGTEISVSEQYRRLRTLRENREVLDTVIRQMNACAEVLRPLAPMVDGGQLEASKESIPS